MSKIQWSNVGRMKKMKKRTTRTSRRAESG
jgi:hypothetical protein